MFASWVGGNDGLGAALGKPIAQAAGVVGPVCDQPQRASDDAQQGAGALQVVRITGRELESAGATLLIGQGVYLRGAAAARAPDGMTEGPPFAPAAERWALTWVESTAAVPTMPVEPVSA